MKSWKLRRFSLRIVRRIHLKLRGLLLRVFAFQKSRCRRLKHTPQSFVLASQFSAGTIYRKYQKLDSSMNGSRWNAGSFKRSFNFTVSSPVIHGTKLRKAKFHGAENIKPKTTKRKTWLVDPDRRWPVQGW
ncbi:hypothetical protein O6H91_05G086700 [Diphasiastrum complanatum]|uniref:Uncharacterized protein n=1 Tax=Diphasiastrum complanatum TaxID=34168 RepID=A0ACC2DQB3_DIPCM|nr:hypothetical protein O6H91_05G086700 [Diphasiastrum complanatum]